MWTVLLCILDGLVTLCYALKCVSMSLGENYSPTHAVGSLIVRSGLQVAYNYSEFVFDLE